MIYGNKFLITESKKDYNLPKTINFFGDEYKIKFLDFDNEENTLEKLPQPMIDKMIKLSTVVGKEMSIYNKMAKLVHSWDEGSWTDKITSGSKLVESIKNESRNKKYGFELIHGKGNLYFCGEYDVDREHGFAIEFLKGSTTPNAIAPFDAFYKF